MMTRINSSKLARCKTVLVLPLVALLLTAFSIENAMERAVDKTQLQSQINSSNSIPSIFPVKKVEGVKISSGFGMRMHPIYKIEKFHKAVDIVAPKGTPIFATADGLVREVASDFVQGKGYGRKIIIDHKGGYSTLYAQLLKYNTKEGIEVKQGDVIGYVGSSGTSTGPHLHYEVMKDGENVDPEDYF